MSERREQLCRVTVSNEPISPPKKLGFIRFVAKQPPLLLICDIYRIPHL